MQQIIIYQNPAEVAFWQLMSNGEMLPIIAGIVVFFAAMFAGQTWIVEKYFGAFGKRNKAATKINLIVSTSIAALVAWYMFGKI